MNRLFYVLLALCLLPGGIARAQEDPPEEEIDLFDAELELLAEEDIVIAAAKHKQKIGFSPSAVIVITRKDIEESGATSLVELLRRYPALYTITINPSHHMVFARGSYRVLLLLDGRELNMELFPPPFYETLPVGIHNMERIEIVLGPNSALYGANAVSAIINIVTRKPGTDFHTDLSLAAGHNGSTVFDCMLEGGIGSWAFQGTFGIDRENSWADRNQTPRDLLRTTGTAQFSLDDGLLRLNGGLIAGDLLLFSDGMGYVPVNNILFTHSKIDFELGDLKARFYWYHIEADAGIELNLSHPDMGITLGTFPAIELYGNVIHTDVQYDLELFEGNLLIAGADFWYTHYHAEQIVGEDLSEIRTGAFLHDEQRLLDRILLTVGARFDSNSKTRTAISPQVAAVYNPAGEHYLRLSWGMAFRKPVLMETGAKLKVIGAPGFENDMKRLFEEEGMGNPDLDNEILSTVELGYLGFLFDKALRLDANAYYAKNEKAIELEVNFAFKEFMQLDFDNTSFGYINRESIEHIFGASASIEGDLLDELTLFLRGEYRKIWVAYKTRDEWIELNKHMRASAGGVLRLPQGITASLAAFYVGPWPDTLLDPRSVLAGSTWADLPERIYLMAHLSYKLNVGTARLHLGLSVFNPFGPQFREKLGTTAPDNTNYGGEIIGPRAMLTARLVY
jgi:iron complex outermembrane receptor protein